MIDFVGKLRFVTKHCAIHAVWLFFAWLNVVRGRYANNATNPLAGALAVVSITPLIN